MSPLFSTSPEKRKRFLAASCALGLVVLVALGVFAKNGWLPSTDPLTGKKTSWFGRTLSQNASDVLGPSVAAPPNPTPRYTKDYVYAGDRLVSVVDANAQEAPPTDLAVWRPSTGTWWVMGGQGSLGGTLVGALIIGVLRNGLNLLGVSSFLQQIVIGVVIVGAVLVDTVLKRHRE